MRLDSRPKPACNGNQFIDVVLGARTRRGEARKNPLWPDFLTGHLERPRPQWQLDGQSSTNVWRATRGRSAEESFRNCSPLVLERTAARRLTRTLIPIRSVRRIAFLSV